MNCQIFETVVAELACDNLMDATSRKRGLAHAGSCARCAARLADERALTDALNLAASAETSRPSARVKSALVSAFHEMKEARADLAASASMPANPLPQRKPARLFWAAAVILALLAIPAIWSLISSRHAKPDTAKTGETTASTTQETKQPGVDHSTTDKSEKVAQEDQKPSRDNRFASRKRRKQTEPLTATTRPASTENRDSPTELVTEYIPLTYVANSKAIKSGQIVRIEVSRSSLLALGLPINVNRMNERVKADVIISDDGLARAIRLVYDTGSQKTDNN